MTKRSSLLIRLSLLALAALFSVQANAALGKMRVISKLGQPLHAEIALTGSTGKNPGTLRAGVIANGQFKELTISSQTQAGNISLNVVRRGKGRVLVVKSSNPVNEPLFRFVIQALASNGSVTREYAVTLDPPQYYSPGKQSGLYHRHSGQAEVSSATRGGLIKANHSNSRGWKLFKVNETSQPGAVVTVAPATAEASSAAVAPIDMTLMELEAQVKARDEAIQANNQRLADLEKKVEALKQQMAQPGSTQGQTANNGGEGSGIIDMLMDNLMYVGLAVVLIILLALLAVRSSRRKNEENNSPALTLHVGTPFAGAGTQQQAPKQPEVPKPMAFNQNAQQRQASAQATFMTDFTQMSGAIDTGEVDPIAEAEVYIAYGRDAQAEEILLDALKQDPSRHEVRMKLMELYASKSDVQHFEKLAQEMHDAFDGRGALWAKAAAMGLALDPANHLYQMSEAPATRPAPPPTVSERTDTGLISLDDELAAADLSAQFGEEPVGDLGDEITPAELEDSNDELLSALFSETAPDDTVEEFVAQETVDLGADDGQQLNFSLDSLLAMSNTDQEQEDAAAKTAAEEAEKDALLEFDLHELASADIDAAPLNPEQQKPAEASASAFSADFIEFDLPATDKETDDEHKVTAAASQEDPLSTKLDLAQVYLDMGDEEGAKEVLQELLAEADGSLRDEALGMLARIGA